MINLGCVTPLGMENKVIHDEEIDASSQLDNTHSASQDCILKQTEASLAAGQLAQMI